MPFGAGTAELTDASANALIAIRIDEGNAEPLPPAPPLDSRGLPIAI